MRNKNADGQQKEEKQLFITLAQDQTHTLLKCLPWVIVLRCCGGSSTDNAARPELIRAEAHLLFPKMECFPCNSSTLKWEKSVNMHLRTRRQMFFPFFESVCCCCCFCRWDNQACSRGNFREQMWPLLFLLMLHFSGRTWGKLIGGIFVKLKSLFTPLALHAALSPWARAHALRISEHIHAITGVIYRNGRGICLEQPCRRNSKSLDWMEEHHSSSLIKLKKGRQTRPDRRWNPDPSRWEVTVLATTPPCSHLCSPTNSSRCFTITFHVLVECFSVGLEYNRAATDGDFHWQFIQKIWHLISVKHSLKLLLRVWSNQRSTNQRYSMCN